MDTNYIDESKPWHEPLVNWARQAEQYLIATDAITDLMYSYFQTPASFASNEKEIKRVIGFGLSPADTLIMLETDQWVNTTRTPEMNEKWKIRREIMRRINRVYQNLKISLYGRPMIHSSNTSVDSSRPSELDTSFDENENMSEAKTPRDEDEDDGSSSRRKTRKCRSNPRLSPSNKSYCDGLEGGKIFFSCFVFSIYNDEVL